MTNTRLAHEAPHRAIEVVPTKVGFWCCGRLLGLQLGCGHPKQTLYSRTRSGGPPSALNSDHNRAGQILEGATHRDHDSAVVRAGDGLRQCGLL